MVVLPKLSKNLVEIVVFKVKTAVPDMAARRLKRY